LFIHHKYDNLSLSVVDDGNIDFDIKVKLPYSIHIYIYITFTFNKLADAFIQNDLQMRTIEAVKLTVGQQYASAMTITLYVYFKK